MHRTLPPVFQPHHGITWLSYRRRRAQSPVDGRRRRAAFPRHVSGNPRRGEYPTARLGTRLLRYVAPTAGGFSDRFYARLGLEYGAKLSEQERRDIAASVQTAVEDIVVRFAGEGENLCLAGGLMLNAPLVSALETSAATRTSGSNRPPATQAPASAALSMPGIKPAETLSAIRSTISSWAPAMTGKRSSKSSKTVSSASATSPPTKPSSTRPCAASTTTRSSLGSKAAWSLARAPRQSQHLRLTAQSLFTENLNVYIKRRELFRKFAASVPEELASDYFDCTESARFLASVQPRQAETSQDV